MFYHIRVATFTLLFLLSSHLVFLGCTNSYPDSFTGDISGHVMYDGKAASKLKMPILIVSAYAYQPDIFTRLRSGQRVISHASYMVVQPVFELGPIEYQLHNLEPYEKGYLVSAVILDLDNINLGAVASGAYPDMSMMVIPPTEGQVNVVIDETLTSIDFDMMDIPKSRSTSSVGSSAATGAATDDTRGLSMTW